MLVALALLAIPTLLVGPALLPGRAFLPADLLLQFEPWRSQAAALPTAHWDALVWDGIAQYYPWRTFAAESLRAGHIPLWNPYQFCGTPFVANGQSAVFYPLNVLFWLLPVAVAFGWSAWLHLVLAGWFAYLFLRRAVGVGRIGAVAGAIVWQGNSFTVAWLHLPTTLSTVAWLPLVLLFVARGLVSGRLRYALAAGVALGVSYLGGHPQAFLYVGLFTMAYVVVRGLSRVTAASLPTRLGRLALVGVLAGTVALGIAAVQLLPTLDFLPWTHRTFTPGPESYAAFLRNALQPIQLVGLVVPHPLGHPGTGSYLGPENYAEYTLYVGLVGLCLGVWAMLFVRTWHSRFLAAAGLASLLLAAGTGLNWPLYHWVPGIANTGSPARLVVLFLLAMSMLAGAGVDGLAREDRARRRLFLLALLAVALAAVVRWWFELYRVTSLPAHLPMGLMPLADRTGIAAVALVLAAAACTLLVRRRRARAVQVGFVVILLADLVLAAQGHLHIVPHTWVYADSANPGPVGGRVLANAGTWGLGSFPTAVLPPNAATVYHLRDVAGYDSLYFAHYRDFAALLQHGDPSPPLNGNMLLLRLPRVYDRGVMQLAGVDRVLSSLPLPDLTAQPAEGYFRYDHLGGWPRARVVESAVFCPDAPRTREAMLRLGVLPNLAIITGPDEPAPRFAPGPPPMAELTDVSPNAVTVDLPRGGGGYLLLADTYAPGWRAYGDGKVLPIRLAYLAFRAVPLPQEVGRVEFRYEPASFRLGLFLGLTMLAALAAVCGALLPREVRRGR